MSATQALFTGTGVQNREVLNCFYELKRPVDHKGRPSGLVQGGVITLEFISSDDDNSFVDWLSSFQSRNGCIIFLDIDGAEMKRLEFTGGRCVGYSEQFTYQAFDTISREEVMKFTITILANKILSMNGTVIFHKQLSDEDWF